MDDCWLSTLSSNAHRAPYIHLHLVFNTHTTPHAQIHTRHLKPNANAYDESRGVPNHWQLDCLINRRCGLTKNHRAALSALCVRNPWTDGFSSKRVSNAECFHIRTLSCYGNESREITVTHKKLKTPQIAFIVSRTHIKYEFRKLAPLTKVRHCSGTRWVAGWTAFTHQTHDVIISTYSFYIFYDFFILRLRR